jgi:radical SAM superfamily enzyme YgiQ (UPF0313 family)
VIDILLIYPPSRSINHYRPPLSLIYLAGYLEKNGLFAEVIDLSDYDQIRDKKFWKNKDHIYSEIKRELLARISKIETKAIGISCFTPEYQEVLDLIKDIRKLSSAKIVIGGTHPTLKPDDFTGIADVIIQGEGEAALYEALSRDLSGIVVGKQMPLDEISFPDYSKVDMDHYCSANPYVIRGVFIRAAYIHASRGCPSSCSFCVSKNLRPYFGHGRLRSAQKIWDEVINLKDKYMIDAFYIPDDLFTIKKSYVLDFCKRSTGIPWGCSAKVTTLDEETIKAMASANCIQIDFGVERGSNDAMNRVNKGQTIEKVIEVFDLCKKYKIRTFANFMVNFPDETENDRKDICDLIKRIDPSIVSMNVFMPYLGTDIQETLNDDTIFGWASAKNVELNPIWKTLRFHLSLRYISILIKSKYKFDYIRQSGNLIREAINMTGG